MIIMKIYFYPSRNQKKKTRKKQQPNKRNKRESNFDFGMYIFFLIFEVVLYYIREVWICVFFFCSVYSVIELIILNTPLMKHLLKTMGFFFKIINFIFFKTIP